MSAKMVHDETQLDANGDPFHWELYKKLKFYHTTKWCPRGVMVKAMHCRIVVREFVLQSRYYVHFRKYPWEKV